MEEALFNIPLLVYLLGYNPIVSTAYSLFVVGTTSIVGTYKKYKEGLVDFKTGLTFSFPSFLAVYLTRRFVVPGIPNTLISIGDFQLTKAITIMALFAIIMFVAAISMIKKGKSTEETSKKQTYYKTFFQGLAIGAITRIIGAGGGFLYVPALVLWANITIKKAVGTSLIIISINSLIGFLGDVQTLNIEWRFLLIFTLISIVGGILIGNYFSKFISSEKLKKRFGIFILIMAIFIFYKELY